MNEERDEAHRGGTTAATATGRRAEGACDRRRAVLEAAVDALHWRLHEAATRIDEAHDALARQDLDHARDRPLDIEPLVFEVERVLSGVFVMEREMLPGATPPG